MVVTQTEKVTTHRFGIGSMHVLFPPGSGGSWLAGLLHFAKDGKKDTNPTNIHFHYVEKVNLSHTPENFSNSIVINSELAKYNFWCNWYYKTYLNDKPTLGQENISNIDVLVNSARFIRQWNYSAEHTIEYTDLWLNQKCVFNVLQDYLCSHNFQNNFLTFKQLQKSIENYKSTLSNIPIRFDIYTEEFKAWAIGTLEVYDISIPYDVEVYWESTELTDFLQEQYDFIIEKSKHFIV